MDLEFRHVMTQVLAFILMYWILKRYAWDHIYGVIDDRRKRIQSEFSSIENEKLEMKKLNAAYQQKLSDIDSQANAKFQEAIAEGRKIAEEIQQSTQKESAKILSKARESIEREVLQARTALKDEIVNLTIAASKKIIHEDLNSEKQKNLIREFVDKAEVK